MVRGGDTKRREDAELKPTVLNRKAQNPEYMGTASLWAATESHGTGSELPWDGEGSESLTS